MSPQGNARCANPLGGTNSRAALPQRSPALERHSGTPITSWSDVGRLRANFGHIRAKSGQMERNLRWSSCLFESVQHPPGIVDIHRRANLAGFPQTNFVDIVFLPRVSRGASPSLEREGRRRAGEWAREDMCARSGERVRAPSLGTARPPHGAPDAHMNVEMRAATRVVASRLLVCPPRVFKRS